jgi:hypothetical protein
VGLPIPVVVGWTPGLFRDHAGLPRIRRPAIDLPPSRGLLIEVEAVDVEIADVRLVRLDRFCLAWLFMDLHRAVEPGRVVVVAATGGGGRARRGEHQESQTREEGQDSGCLAHWLVPPVLDLRGPMRGDVLRTGGRARSNGSHARNAMAKRDA